MQIRRWGAPVFLVACTGVLACGESAPRAAPDKSPPAAVTTPVKEADLTTVKLTAQAEQRLGIQTVAVERRSVARTRTVGGEVVVPPGSQVVVSAPVAGTLQAPQEGVVSEPFRGRAPGERLEEHRVKEDGLSPVLTGNRFVVMDGVIVARARYGLDGASKCQR